MLKDIKVGSKLFINYGAMYPTRDLEVVDFEGIYAVAVDIDGEVTKVHLENIREFGTTSANGSPIGAFLLPVLH